MAFENWEDFLKKNLGRKYVDEDVLVGREDYRGVLKEQKIDFFDNKHGKEVSEEATG